KGVAIHVFTGNHDMWMFDYFEQELGVKMHRKPIQKTWNGKQFMIGHGDGLGPGDHSYKLLKKVFSNALCIWLFKWIHPDLGMKLADFWSRKSRNANGPADEIYNGDEKEWLLQYTKSVLKTEHFDYFIFGHRHLVLDKKVGEKSRYINLGAWFKNPHYAFFDGEELSLVPYSDVIS
ncbi:UDP-2,3-diacylglucosamine diphosphatase, partial [Bacteroidota bacterium]